MSSADGARVDGRVCDDPICGKCGGRVTVREEEVKAIEEMKRCVIVLTM